MTKKNTILTAAALAAAVALSPLGASAATIMKIGFATINARLGRVETSAITAEQFGEVPRVSDPSRVTLAEEDRLVGYFAGGAMYATPLRSEPLL